MSTLGYASPPPKNLGWMGVKDFFIILLCFDYINMINFDLIKYFSVSDCKNSEKRWKGGGKIDFFSFISTNETIFFGGFNYI